MHCAEEGAAHYKAREEAGDKLIMEAGHLSDLLFLSEAKLCQILTPSLPHFAPTQSYLKASVSLCLAFGLQILNGNQADCLPICPQPVEEEGQPMEICPKN